MYWTTNCIWWRVKWSYSSNCRNFRLLSRAICRVFILFLVVKIRTHLRWINLMSFTIWPVIWSSCWRIVSFLTWSIKILGIKVLSLVKSISMILRLKKSTKLRGRWTIFTDHAQFNFSMDNTTCLAQLILGTFSCHWTITLRLSNAFLLGIEILIMLLNHQINLWRPYLLNNTFWVIMLPMSLGLSLQLAFFNMHWLGVLVFLSDTRPLACIYVIINTRFIQ